MLNPDRSKLKPEQLNTRSISIETTKTTSLAILVCGVSTLTSLTGYQSAIAQTTSPVVMNRSSEPDVRANPNIDQNRPQIATSIDSRIHTVSSLSTRSNGSGQLTVNPGMVELGLKPVYALGEKSPTTPASYKIAQASDVAGNWAEPFIRVLVDKGIIKGYPDSTFRPDQSVSRAEFAALLNKAFDLQPVRAESKFKDVPTKYWAAEVIQKAYRGGFLTGYPNQTFAPNQNIIRIQSLVSLTNGGKLTPSGNLDLNRVFGDAAQVPSYGQNSLIAATQSCLAVSQEYDSTKLPGGNFGPNTVATRADVAAYIHQTLVAGGKLSALDKASTGNKYIASCPQGVYVTNIKTEKTPTISKSTPVNPDLNQYLLREPPTIGTAGQRGKDSDTPGSSISAPGGFGADYGNLFAGIGYQARTRFTQKDDLALSTGIGLGDARKFLGLEISVGSFSPIRTGPLSSGSISFKAHRLISSDTSIAVGVENLVTWGVTDGGTSTYGVISKYFPLKNNIDEPFSSISVSIGAGNGRFRSESDVALKKETINPFGSIGMRIARPVSFIVDWSGQTLGLGLSIAPIRDQPLTINPAVVDITGGAGDGARFILGIGYGITF